MRIAMVASAISRRGGGVATAVEGLSRYVKAAGATIRVFSISDQDADNSDWGGAEVTLSKAIGPSKLGYAPGMLGDLIAFQPDIVHLHGLWMHTSRTVAQWSLRTRRPYVISPHGMLAPAALEFSRKKKFLARMLYQDAAFSRASGFHATSEQEVDQIRSFGLTQPVELIPIGIDFRPLPPNVHRRNSVLSLGRIHPVKGLDLLIRSWARLAPTFSEHTLDIFGPDDAGYRAELERLSRELGAERISFHGPVYGDEKYRLLAEAAVFVLPSRTENFGLTVVESLMMETPVIATKTTPWASLERQGCGWWVSPNETDFFLALQRALKLDAAVLRAMGVAGRNWVEKEFNWSRVAHKTLSAYAQLLNER